MLTEILLIPKYNTIQSDVLGLGNNTGQKINRFLFPNMMTAEPKVEVVTV